ncbi:MAG: ribonuclease H-like domain-containing protein [Fimbriimonadaceae bacterium]|nr:ribonuclease H-like domain-containing protein [Fimbriimonadaceae bacterium]QYK57120.1 MAG: ribonuclease H-like domain-containing protein [Fimbriimonadaceae bacterium]
MLRHTFVHLPGVGHQAERALWRQGCHTWDDYLSAPKEFRIGSADRGQVTELLHRSVEALENREHQFFARWLGAREAWRAWEDFRDSCIYLDIETDGRAGGDSVTCVGLYDGNTFRCLIAGEDLAVFADAITYYSYIVTFFGTGFDIPVLQKAFPHVMFDHIHLDLCHVMKRLGMQGGLKRIEYDLGITRCDETRGLTGRDAVRLWRRHLYGDESALPILVAYNREDVVNLAKIAQIAYDRLRIQTSLDDELGKFPKRALRKGEPSLFDVVVEHGP